MALARIITRSHACSRELALDLLARGYAVEIVSPDAIPDNIADLELRVDTGPGDQLIASVEAHDGGRSASLEFLHHLKAPMGDFLRRPPEPRGVAHLSAPPANFNAEPRFGVVTSEVLSEPARSSEPVVSVGTGASPVRGESKTRQQPAASRITPSQQKPPLQQAPRPSIEVPKYFAVEEPAIPRLMDQDQPAKARKAVRRDPAARWRWWTALTFASLAMLALGFGFGLRRTENASAQLAAASIDTNLMSPSDSEKNSEPVSSAIVPARKVSPVAPAEIAVAAPSTARPRAKVSRRHESEMIAPNTITYLDKHFEPRASATSAGKGKPVKHVARRHASRHPHRGEVVIANKVTDLDKPTRKAAK